MDMVDSKKAINYLNSIVPYFTKLVFMNADQLKSLQAPLKERYREQPESAIITLKAQGEIGAEISCKVDTGRSLVEAGLHPATGGTGLLACSGDMLLEALAACAGVTLKAVATAIGVDVSGTIWVEGDLDFKGTLGVSKEVPVGFKSIRLHFSLQSNVSEEELTTLKKLTERYCVVYQTLIKGVTVETVFHQPDK
jgi:uncharacterized OsmC-like protein